MTRKQALFQGSFPLAAGLRVPSYSRVMLGLVLALSALASSAAECRKTVRWLHYPPYFIAGPNSEIKGIHADLVTGILRHIGCLPVFVELPFARAIVELEDGTLDILAGAAQTQERARFAYFSSPVERHPNALFLANAAVRKYSLKRLGDIKGTDFRLGVQKNASYGVEYEALKHDPDFLARLVPVIGEINAWKMMSAGRIDGLIADEESAAEEIEREGFQNAISKSDLVLQTTPSFIALSRKSLDTDFAARFDRALKGVIASGELATIFERYGRCPTVGTKRICR